MGRYAPSVSVEVPLEIRLALRTPVGAWPERHLWRNEAGGSTFLLEAPDDAQDRILKIAPRGHPPSLRHEAERMRWAADHLPVPTVDEVGQDARWQWLLTRRLGGVDAVRHPRRGEDPGAVVEALARGLRRMHSIPVSSCPFSFRLDDALALAERRISAGRLDPAQHLAREHAHLDAAGVLRQLERTRPCDEDLVLCHGDYCFPNVLLGPDLEVKGFIDLGGLAVADRWWDLAVATWSTGWNAGVEHQAAFLRAYGVEPDPERQAFFRLLYDVVG